MAFGSLSEALSFWFQHVNFEQKTAAPKDLKLDRMRALLARLGNPEKQLAIIHVAGSKGKGSTSAFVASMLQHAGHVTGLFTSPHLTDVQERMQVNGARIADDELTELLSEVQDAVESGDPLPVTFFEIGVAVGYLHFVRKRVDLAVVEVGLGGRFDSTNTCDPLAALITSISIDHVQQLGSTLERIAREKAGIVKPGRPTINGTVNAAARRVIAQVCRERRSPLRQRDVDFHYDYEPGVLSGASWRPPRARIQVGDHVHEALEMGLLGEHQASNAAVAVACIEELRTLGWTVSDDAIAQGLARTTWPARLEVMQRSPLVILDCAHNVASARALIDTLRASFHLDERSDSERILIFSCSHDKDQRGILRALLPHFTQVILPRQLDQPRLAAPEETAARVRGICGVQAVICESPEDAWRRACDQAREDDLICITGSVFLAGAIRAAVLATPACGLALQRSR